MPSYRFPTSSREGMVRKQDRYMPSPGDYDIPPMTGPATDVTRTRAPNVGFGTSARLPGAKPVAKKSDLLSVGLTNC